MKMDTHQLMFELSHPVRFNILRAIENEPQRMTRICELIEANSPEVSRHLERLKKAHLVSKEPEGAYRISPLGKMTLALLPGFTFIANNDVFFRDHDLTGIPPSFIANIGDLRSGVHEHGVFAAIKRGVKMTENAQEHIYFVTNESSHEFDAVLEEKHKLDLDIRYILDIGYPFTTTPPRGWNPDIYKNLRIYDGIPAMIGGTENEASICFKSTRGECDFQSSFFSREKPFVQWVNDLFEHLWENSMTLAEFESLKSDWK